uniref:Uncharacterized protein n=1 Tax=Candidatus Kentrum sp. FW TaxID=2126338 RepID=A0A450TSX4_9GAMM|nr:MAG: hypothetical protein BECKFW1821C_GA0114237_102724 [Candidatus Kentron sp. FW]
MATAKTVTLAFCIEPEWKEAPRAAAERKHRFIANMVVSIMEHCERSGIPIPEVPAAASKRTTSGKGG